MPSGLPGCRWRWMGDILRSERGVEDGGETAFDFLFFVVWFGYAFHLVAVH